MARFFIDRPVFAMVLSMLILIAGAASIPTLPVAQYPNISPPQISVVAVYPGASAEVVGESVALPIEAELNGAEGMLYMTSSSTNDGRYVLRVTFEVGRDLDLAAVDIQNRLKRAEPKLPAEVVRNGVVVKKQSPDMLMVTSLKSPDGSVDDLFLSNYAAINVVDTLARVPGVGSVEIFGRRDFAMRLWLEPDRMARLGVTVSEVVAALREQNIQAPAGSFGSPPTVPGTERSLPVVVRGRLLTPEQFSAITLRTLPDGSVLRLGDIARVELGAQDYGQFGRLDGNPAVPIGIYQLPGANAVATASRIRETLDTLAEGFPDGVAAEVTFDSTQFVTSSIREVIHTLFEAFVLVLLVVMLFLGSLRATLIPMLAVPVSLIGTFALFGALDFSINTLTLFGMVLAIGIVVDDAIVVVEAVEHHIAEGLEPRDATIKAMQEVSGPVIGIALVLCSVFIPVAFMGGITGQLYKQFALTLSIAVLISALVALSLTPALCALMLRPRSGRKNIATRFFDRFNRMFDAATQRYGRAVALLCRRLVLAPVVLAVVCLLTWRLAATLPTTFVPSEDQGYLFVAANTPPGSSLESTDSVLRDIEALLEADPDIASSITIGGINMLSGSYGTDTGSVIAVLEDWGDRPGKARHADAVLARVKQGLIGLPEATAIAVNPPPLPGIGTGGGFKFQLQNRSAVGTEALEQAAFAMIAAARQAPEIGTVYTFQRGDVPRIALDVDRDKAKQLGIQLNEVFESLQALLGGVFVNEFNQFGRSFRVMAQADAPFRMGPESLDALFVRTAAGEMTPLSNLASTTEETGPGSLVLHNLFPTVEISGAPAPGFSSGDAIAAMERLAREALPEGFGFEWTELAFQEKESAGTAGVILILALVFVFLVLAALYESWAIPFAVMLGLPLGAFGAFAGQWLRGGYNDVYTQVGLVMLIGLAAKNAILIVEFARMKHGEGCSPVEAAVEAARLRLRPILMTSFAFILGVVPLLLATGPGAASRNSMGTAVFSGMTAATFLGIFLIPALFVLVLKVGSVFRRQP